MGGLVERLACGLAEGAVVVDPAVMAAYRFDMAGFCEAGEPAVLVFPSTVEEVRHVMCTATELGVPVVPQGRGPGSRGRRTRWTAASCCRW